MQDTQGRALIYRIEEDTYRLIESAFAEHTAHSPLVLKGLEKYADEWTRILKTSCDEGHLKIKIIFLYALEQFYRVHPDMPPSHIKIYLDRCHLGFYLAKNLKLSFPSPHSLLFWP